MLSKYNALFERAFKVLNDVYFDGELPDVVITIQSRPKAYGYITVNKVWSDDTAYYHEINISAEYLNRPIENTLATLQHELIHLYCMENDIADTSNGGRYHNKRFKAEAEKRGLQISYRKYIGYSVTQPTVAFVEILKTYGLLEFSISHYRDEYGYTDIPTTGTSGGDDNNGINIPPAPAKKKSSTRKYICSSCGISVRATKDVNIICGDCMNTMDKMET